MTSTGACLSHVYSWIPGRVLSQPLPAMPPLGTCTCTMWAEFLGLGGSHTLLHSMLGVLCFAKGSPSIVFARTG